MTVARPSLWTAFAVAFALVFLSGMQYWSWAEAVDTGRQLPDPLMPCALGALAIAPALACLYLLPYAVWQLRQKRLLKLELAEAHAAQAVCAHTSVPVTVHTGPTRVVWKPDDGLPEKADADVVCRLALENRCSMVIVHMKPAAEQAARVFIEQAWARIAGEHRPAPTVLPPACGGLVKPAVYLADKPDPFRIPAGWIASS